MRYISRMFTLPKMPSIKMPDIDFPNIDLTKFDLGKFDLSKFDLSKFDLPNVDLSKLDVAKADRAKVIAALRDAGYVVVGLTATLAEQLQTRSEQWSTTANVAVNEALDQVRGFLHKAA